MNVRTRIAHNEFDYVTFRRRAECVRSAMRCAPSKPSKTARIRTSEARAQGPSTVANAVSEGAEHIIRSYLKLLPAEFVGGGKGRPLRCGTDLCSVMLLEILFHHNYT